jgi:uncharacterized protein (TIGR03086 family)
MATRHGSATVTLPSDTEILLTRAFEAPRLIVWEALTTPRHLLRWWGPDWCPLVTCEIDLRPTGTWRYVARDVDGNELAWHGTYRDIVATERIVTTETFEGYPDATSVNTMTLDEEDGVTTLRTLVAHTSREHRDGHVASGMEQGMQVTFDRLDNLLDTSATPSGRYQRVAAAFAQRVIAMPPDAWDRPAPCAGWAGRDIVAHLVEWIPAVLSRAGIDFPPMDPASDPTQAWSTLDATLQGLLDDPEVAHREFDAGPPGRLTVESAIEMLVVGDLLIHTWDLAHTGGLDDTLPADLVVEMLIGMEPLDDMLRSSGHYGPRVAVPDDADQQARLIAFTGRDPFRVP